MEKKCIIIAEDDHDLQYILQLHLGAMGYVSVNVQSILDATRSLKTTHSGIMLLDNHLTDGVALDHIDQIKRSTPNVSIILMTADFIDQLKEHRNYNFLDGVLLKPFAPETLRQVVENAGVNVRFYPYTQSYSAPPGGFSSGMR